MAFVATEGSSDGNINEIPMTTGITIYTGEPVFLSTATGYAVVPTTTASRLFVGWSEETKTSAGADGDDDLRVYTGATQKENVTILGTGASDILQVTDLGKTVYCTGRHAYTVVAVTNAVPCGTLVRIRSLGTNADGLGDILWNGLERGGDFQQTASIVALTNSTGETGDDTVAAISLTNSTGVTGDTTIAAVSMTNSTGVTGDTTVVDVRVTNSTGVTPDSTIAAATLTNSTGVTPDTTIAATSLTNSTGTTGDSTIANVGTAVGTGGATANKSDVDARLTLINANFGDIAVRMNLVNANFSDLAAKAIINNANFSDISAKLTLVNANTADLALRLNTANANFADLALRFNTANSDMADLTRKVNLIITALDNAGITV